MISEITQVPEGRRVILTGEHSSAQFIVSERRDTSFAPVINDMARGRLVQYPDVTTIYVILPSVGGRYEFNEEALLQAWNFANYSAGTDEQIPHGLL